MIKREVLVVPYFQTNKKLWWYEAWKRWGHHNWTHPRPPRPVLYPDVPRRGDRTSPKGWDLTKESTNGFTMFTQKKTWTDSNRFQPSFSWRWCIFADIRTNSVGLLVDREVCVRLQVHLGFSPPMMDHELDGFIIGNWLVKLAHTGWIDAELTLNRPIVSIQRSPG